MSKPVTFDDLCKKAKDVLNDDYFSGAKMTMKIKHIKGVNITAEGKTADGKPVVCKVSGDFEPCEYVNMKKLSIDSVGCIIADADIKKLVKDTSFTIRTQKNFNESGIAKSAFGFKVTKDSFIADGAYDVPTNKYYASMVYGYKSAMIGTKVYGCGKSTPTADFGASYQYNDILCSCVAYDLFKKMDFALYYALSKKTSFSAICGFVIGSGVAPSIDFGMTTKTNDTTQLRTKVNSAGILSACLKTTVDEKMAFTGSVAVDVMNLSTGNHKVGFGIEFLF